MTHVFKSALMASCLFTVLLAISCDRSEPAQPELDQADTEVVAQEEGASPKPPAVNVPVTKTLKDTPALHDALVERIRETPLCDTQSEDFSQALYDQVRFAADERVGFVSAKELSDLTDGEDPPDNAPLQVFKLPQKSKKFLGALKTLCHEDIECDKERCTLAPGGELQVVLYLGRREDHAVVHGRFVTDSPMDKSQQEVEGALIEQINDLLASSSP